MIDESDRLIGLIYEGIVDDSHWGAALERVAAFVGAIGVGLGTQDMPRGRRFLRRLHDPQPHPHVICVAAASARFDPLSIMRARSRSPVPNCRG